jgi:hypothetical protein
VRRPRARNLQQSQSQAVTRATTTCANRPTVPWTRCGDAAPTTPAATPHRTTAGACRGYSKDGVSAPSRPPARMTSRNETPTRTSHQSRMSDALAPSRGTTATCLSLLHIPCPCWSVVEVEGCVPNMPESACHVAPAAEALTGARRASRHFWPAPPPPNIHHHTLAHFHSYPSLASFLSTSFVFPVFLASYLLSTTYALGLRGSANRLEAYLRSDLAFHHTRRTRDSRRCLRP